MRRTLFGALAALTALGVVLLVSAVASAAPSSITFVPPSPAEGATLTGDSVSFAFTYPKKPDATRTLTCTLAGPTASSGPCDAPVAEGSKGSKSGVSFSGLADGDYTLTVSLVLTDGGTATATRRFSVRVPSADPTAVADSFTVAESSGFTLIDVFANDINPDGGPLEIIDATTPANGLLGISAATVVTYLPYPGYCNSQPGGSPDTFTYTLNGGSTATVSMTVTCD